MHQRILVPLDGSDFAAAAVPTAEAVAARRGGTIHLVHVLHDPLDFPGTAPLEDIGRKERTRQAASDYLEQQAQALEATEGVTAETDVIEHAGPPPEVLDRYADDHAIDLVVMTTHGEGGVRRLWLGSVADGLLRRASVPLLLLRPDGEIRGLAEGTVEEILVPLDGSSEGEEVLRHAQSMAESFDAALRLVRVVPPGGGLGRFRADPEAAEKEGLAGGAHDPAREYLEEVADTLRRRSDQEITVEVEVVGEAQPADGILQRAEAASVDLVALATHGRGGFQRLLLGSVADKVVRGGTTPVLAVPISPHE